MPAVLSFISQKGGVAKSTLARAIASVAAHSGIAVVIADLDARQQSIVRWGEARREQGRTPIIETAAHETIDDALRAHPDCELLIIDAPGRSDDTTLQIANQSHVVIVPTGAGLDDLYPTVLLLHELTAAGIPTERLSVALCRVLTASEEAEARTYITKAGYAALDGALPERAAFRASHNQGLAIGEVIDAGDRVDRLVEAILKMVIREMKRASESSAVVQLRKGKRT